MKVAAIILAAGGSSRMGGRNKLLLPVEGQPMVARVCGAVLQAGYDPLRVVTGHDQVAVATAVAAAVAAAGVQTVHNGDWASGMASSIRTGLDALPEDADGVLVALGDMPLVGVDTLETLRRSFEAAGGDRIVFPEFDGRQGNPVLIPRKYFAELAAISGDRGGKALLKKHADESLAVAVRSAAVTIDIDSEEAYRALAQTAKEGPVAST